MQFLLILLNHCNYSLSSSAQTGFMMLSDDVLFGYTDTQKRVKCGCEMGMAAGWG